MYPVHTLMVHSVKMAYMGSVFMLFFIWLYEKLRDIEASQLRMCLFSLGSFVIGLFS